MSTRLQIVALAVALLVMGARGALVATHTMPPVNNTGLDPIL